MLEKDIENLIALYPEEFFPKEGFKLKGQQVNLGRCRADIVFTDKYSRTIIVEVKRGTLTRDAAGQILEYYGILKQQNSEQIIELILCANTIPPERRISLERYGIDCKELDTSLILKVAKKYNYKFLDEPKEENIMKVSQEKVKQPQSTKKGFNFADADKLFQNIVNDIAKRNGIILPFVATGNKTSYKKNGKAPNVLSLMNNAKILFNLSSSDDVIFKDVTLDNYNHHGISYTGIKLNSTDDIKNYANVIEAYLKKHKDTINSTYANNK